MKMWIARDKNGSLWFHEKEPIILKCCKSPEDALPEGIKEAVKILKEK